MIELSIIISKDGSGAFRLEPRGIPKETFLQEYVEEHPEVLPLNEIREDIRLFVAAREFGTGSGPIDVLALDDQGSIYVIETKLYKNPDKRQVVAQALDYGASLWSQYPTGSEFLHDLRDYARRLDGSLTLEERIAEGLGIDEAEAGEMLEAAANNLGEGAFHFIVLMDQMDDRLKDLIAFVNENSRFSLYGVELDFYEHDDLEIVIPRMYGAEVKKEVDTNVKRRRSWNEELFFEDASQRLPSGQVEAISKLYEYCQETADLVEWGSGANYGSFNPKFASVSETKSIITVRSNGRLSINIGWLDSTDKAREFVEILSQQVKEKIGFNLPSEFSNRYPNYLPNEWTPKVDQLIAALKTSLQSL